MLNFTLDEIACITGGRYIGRAPAPDTAVHGVTIDSRRVEPGCLFVPIAGERFDGHDFIGSAFEKGAVAALCEKEVEAEGALIRVESTVAAFRALAGAYRRQFRIPVVGVTGSVGKTTTKELIACVLGRRFNTLKNEGNLNNQTGVPLTLFRLSDEHRAAVVEMGTNHFGEIKSLAEIVHPTVGVITNIGEAHIEHLGSRDGILREKSDIFRFTDEQGRAIVNGDDDKLSTLKGKIPNLTTYGFSCTNDIHAENVADMGFEGSRFTAVYDGGSAELHVPAPGRHMVLNALCALAVGLHLGMDSADIAEGIASYVPTEGRMDIIKARRVAVLNDAYNASPTSMRGSIDIACKANGRAVLILGDMLELGERELEYHRQVGEYAAESGAALLLTVGRLSEEMNDAAIAKGMNARHFDTKEQLTERLESLLTDGDTVLIKASHSMGLDKVAKYIAEKF